MFSQRPLNVSLEFFRPSPLFEMFSVMSIQLVIPGSNSVLQFSALEQKGRRKGQLLK